MKTFLSAALLLVSLNTFAEDQSALADSIVETYETIGETYETVAETYETVAETYETVRETYDSLSSSLRKILMLKHERDQLPAMGLFLAFEASYCPVFTDLESTIEAIDPLVEAVNEVSFGEISESERADGLATLESDYKSLLEVCRKSEHEKLITSNISRYKERFDRVADTLYVTRVGGKSNAKAK